MFFFLLRLFLSKAGYLTGMIIKNSMARMQPNSVLINQLMVKEILRMKRKSRQRTTNFYDAHFTNEIIKSCRQNDMSMRRKKTTQRTGLKYLSINKSELIQFSCALPPPTPHHSISCFVKVLSMLFIWLNVSNKVLFWFYVLFCLQL